VPERIRRADFDCSAVQQLNVANPGTDRGFAHVGEYPLDESAGKQQCDDAACD
jgi:hypothetical protein